MASTSKNHHSPSSSSKPPKTPSINKNHTLAANIHGQNPTPSEMATSPPISISLDNPTLMSASHLTRRELLLRRSHYLKQLSKCYRDLYWTLMEQLKIQHRKYYWEYGVSPFKEDNNNAERKESEEKEGGHVHVEGSGDNPNFSTKNQRCLCVGCKLKAMPLTTCCHLHILSDTKQKLYKPCSHVIKSAQSGHITCGKPILRSTVPSLCNGHFQRAQKYVSRALKKAGLNVSSSSKVAPKFHILVAEYVRQIQAKRRVAQRLSENNIAVKEEQAS